VSNCKAELLNKLYCWARELWSWVILSLLDWPCMPLNCDACFVS